MAAWAKADRPEVPKPDHLAVSCVLSNGYGRFLPENMTPDVNYFS
jgi:hypothetical protein